MKVCVLGRIAVEVDEREVVLRSTREASLLADLVVHAGRTVAASTLIDDLWRGDPPPGAASTLQTYVKNLRKLLEPRRAAGAPSEALVTCRPGYMLTIEPDGLDAWRCERLVEDAREALAHGDPALGADRLRAALALWRGPAFGELAGESYLQGEAARLEELRLVAIEARVDADLRLGHHAELCGELEGHVAAHPYRERLWEELMLALYRAGRQADALRAYERVRLILGEELGIEPSEVLRELERAILLHDPELDWMPPPSQHLARRPSGSVTFLFSDVVDSTRLWESDQATMAASIAQHDRIVREVASAYHGDVFSTAQDSIAVAFRSATDAVAAAVDTQRRAARVPLSVRVGLHTGAAEERGGNDFGSAVNVAARIMAAGHGGQVLLSAVTAGLVGSKGLSDLGEHTFAGLDAPARIYQVGAGTFPPLPSPEAVPSNLPVERSVFIGRRRELDTIAGLVRSVQLVTLTGVGGVGKTRLAVRTAARLLGEFPGGVWLVELAPVIDSALVAATIASALGVSVTGGVDSTEAVCRFLAERRALVVLDNCEHVVVAAAALVDRLLAAGPRVRVLATSREPLDVRGESAWRVPSMSLDGDADALALFAARAGQAQPGFSLDDAATAESAVAVCRRLDGIPLAIELAAARARVLSVDQIAAHLDERLRLLTGGGRTTVPRQQTLRGAIDWSYDLLTGPERSLFDTLGVFAGAFDLDAVAAVASLDVLEALDLVEQLVNKSMVEADPARDRYGLLETLRQYAWARLVAGGRLDELREAHAASFAALAARQARRMGDGGQHLDALDRLDRDYDNLRAALAWLIEQRRADEAARMVRRLRRLFIIRHPREGLGWFQAVVAIGGELPAKTRARVLADTAWAALNAGDFEAMAHYAGDAIAAGGDDPPAVADWLFALVAMGAANYTRAVEHLRRAIPNAVANKELTTQVFATGALVLALAEVGDEREARRLIPEAIGLAERLGNPSTLAHNYCQVAVALVRVGAPQEAETMWERSLIHVDMAGPAMACVYRCSYALKVDDPPKAARILGVAIPIAKEHLSGFQQAHPLLAAATIAAATGREQIAARLLGAFNQYGKWTPFVNESRENEHLASQLHDRLGAAVVEDELARGARLTIAQALQLAEDTIVAMP